MTTNISMVNNSDPAEPSKAVGHPLTEAVLASLAGIDDKRMRLLVNAAVAAAHAYVRDVKLRPDELLAATEFLTRVGQASDEVRKEFILLSDATALTMIADDNVHDGPVTSLESSALGPFHRNDSPIFDQNDVIGRPGIDGDPMFVSFLVVDDSGVPVSGALLDLWLANKEGFYENQDPAQPEMNLRGRIRSAVDGTVKFWTVRPSCYPIPDDGPVGELLRLAKRHPWRPAHVHVAVTADGFTPITSALFLADDPYIDSDAVFGVKPSLIVPCTASSRNPPAGCNIGPVWELDHRIVLASARS